MGALIDFCDWVAKNYNETQKTIDNDMKNIELRRAADEYRARDEPHSSLILNFMGDDYGSFF